MLEENVMIHQMTLYEEYFESIKTGKKTVEVRLNDAKRRKINVGDLIEFVNVSNQTDTLTIKVIDLRQYATFKEMYQNIPFSEFDCDGWSMEDMIDGTYEIYTPEQEQEWGTLAITIKYEPK
jgi:ASC-1-like (ASCH) protein